MRHTKEPWEAVTPCPGECCWHLQPVGCDDDGFGRISYPEMTEANARRIVACVNACAGISNADLEMGNAAFINVFNERTEYKKRSEELQRQRDKLLAALEFYAEGHHFILHDSSAWETVSGEPPNFQEDEANTATVEDGTVARTAIAAIDSAKPMSFQSRVRPWLLSCFGSEISADKIERNHRFLEESLELVQSLGCTSSEAHQLVDYVYGRPVGDPKQEVGGVMVTLAALCLASDLDMHDNGETELARVWTKIEKIRAKQAAKPKHSPLPESVQSAPAIIFYPAGSLGESVEGGES